LQPGMVLELHAEDGEHMMAAIVAVDKKLIEVDANHPMAGVDLHFEVEVMAIRAATTEEIEHGHVHGPGGHHH
jgi:FKBP-type peptidyl-prolyl cis-trans isomerase SlyD